MARTGRDARSVNTDSQLTSMECSVPDPQSRVRITPNSTDEETEAQEEGGGLPEATGPMHSSPGRVPGVPAELEGSEA